MTTTVTTTTVTTVTAMGLTAALGIVATLALIGFLIAREVAGAAPDERVIRWGRTLNIGIAPLLVAFAVIVALRIAAAV
jgi:hypothetical protein